jgi:RimJ/RimL family protein N-acetyltransferase
MTKLTPMNQTEFDAFMEISMADHIQGQIKAGSWHAEDADDNMQKLRAQILPQGLVTPNQNFFNVQNDLEEIVGGLWYMIAEREGKHLIFVVDIQIYEPFRRRGFGTQAFRLMENQARDLGITTIALNVFKHNQQAKSMYEKLGYVGKGENMVKELKLGGFK